MVAIPACPGVVFVAPDEWHGRLCDVYARTTALEIILSDGTSYQLPWDAAKFVLGGVEDHHLVITGTLLENVPVYLQVDYFKFAKLAAAIPENIYRDQILVLKGKVKQRKTWYASIAWVISGSIVACVLVLYLSWASLLDLAVQEIPISWETMLGEAAATEFLARNTLITTGKDFDDLNTIFQILKTAIGDEGFTYALYLIDNAEANAFALPGGSIVVHNGLLTAAENAEEVAGVLAHEIQHVRKRHSMRSIVGGLGLTAIAAAFIGDLSGIFAIARDAALDLSLLGYGRDQEREADVGAVRLLVGLKIDPLPMANFFVRMDAQQGDMEQATSYFSTHPTSEERAKTIKGLRDELGKDVQFLPLATVDS